MRPTVPEAVDVAVVVASVRLPQYLERPQIVTRSGDNRLQLAEFDQWGGNLYQDMTRVLAQNLARLDRGDHARPLETWRALVEEVLEPVLVENGIQLQLLAYLGALVGNVPTAANIRHYAQIVRDRSILRQLAATAGDILLIDQLNDGVLVDNVGSEGACTYCSRADGRSKPRSRKCCRG